MQNLYRSAALVTLFATLEHGLGFLYRIFLSRILGAEGLGIYQVAYTVFAVFITLSSSGLPITLSRTVTKHRARKNARGEHGATTAAILISLLFSMPLTILLFLLRPQFSTVFSDPRCADLFYIMIFSLSFTAVYAVIRGYFWGRKQFLAYSLIEFIEEIIMIITGIALLLSASAIPDVNKAAIAILISYLCSFALALVYFIAKGGKFASPRAEFLPLLKSSLPITAMRTSSTLMSSLISVIFPIRLMAAGFTSAHALGEYGVVYGMVMPVLMIPTSLIGSLATVLVPELSECSYKKETAKLSALVSKALSSTLFIVSLLIPFYIVCGEDVGILLYSNAKSGQMITVCALVLVPVGVTMICTSILNSLGHERMTLLFFLFGSCAMLACVWFLPKYLEGGALLVGIACDYFISAICSLAYLRKKTGKLKQGKTICKLAVLVLSASVVGVLLHKALSLCLGYFPAFALSFLATALAELLLAALLRLCDFRMLLRKASDRFLTKRRKNTRTRLDNA